MPSLANAVRSMTGYASARRPLGSGELTVTLRSVNHRGLDLHFPQIGDLAIFENASRSLLKQHIRRGHVEVRFSLEHGKQSTAGGYNRELLERYLNVFKQANADWGLDSKPDLNVLVRLPGVLDQPESTETLDSSFKPDVLQALLVCIRDLNEYREREGQALKTVLTTETEALAAETARIAEIRQEALPHFHQRLWNRLQELLGETGLDETRITSEAAILADRSDIQEELTRLAVHTQELRRILEEGGEVGKRLDFLLQEMNRETNTILSKTSGIGDVGLTITNLALNAKAHIEKIREQALNLE